MENINIFSPSTLSRTPNLIMSIWILKIWNWVPPYDTSVCDKNGKRNVINNYTIVSYWSNKSIIRQSQSPGHPWLFFLHS